MDPSPPPGHASGDWKLLDRELSREPVHADSVVVLPGLMFSQDVIQRFLAMSIFEDSSVYQSIVRKGLEEGRAIGLEQGLERGRQLEATSLILRQLERRIERG